MRRFLFLTSFFFLFQNTFSQALIIDQDFRFKKGIYRDFNEFKYNNPSIEFNYDVKTDPVKYGFVNRGGLYNYYSIIIDKKLGKSVGEVFGFCDGINVYINEDIPKLSSKARFSMIQYFGLYCYFEGAIEYDGAVVLSDSPGIKQSSPPPGKLQKVINIISGEVIVLSKNSVREILKDDPVLFEQFNTQKKKELFLKSYVIEYSEKHRSEIIKKTQ